MKLKVNKTDMQKRARKRLSERNKRAVFVEFSVDEASRLEAVADRLNLTKSEIVRDATASALDALEAMSGK